MDRETRKYWEERRREMLQRDRHQRRSSGISRETFPPLTMALIVIMTLGWVIQYFAGGVLGALVSLPGGTIWLMLISTILPGSLIGLAFAALFVWMIGGQVETVAKPWQYLLVFFGAGIVGSVAATFMGGVGIAGSFAAFGLAGAYVRMMAQFSERGAVQWTLFLLGINVVLSGFQPAILAGMATSFATGLGIALATHLGD